jgi:hypothetical protein
VSVFDLHELITGTGRSYPDFTLLFKLDAWEASEFTFRQLPWVSKFCGPFGFGFNLAKETTPGYPSSGRVLWKISITRPNAARRAHSECRVCVCRFPSRPISASLELQRLQKCK